MSIQAIGLKAYTQALNNFAKTEKAVTSTTSAPAKTKDAGFADMLTSSLEKVNDLQQQRSEMVTAFASGQNQNVHELMISIQKAGLAMNMTAAVRNKVLEAYKELSRMQF